MAIQKSTQPASAASVNKSAKNALSFPPAARLAAAPTPSAGLTPKQLELVLETIACRALALERMLFEISGRCSEVIGGDTLQASIDGALIVANTIGSMADDANSAAGVIVNGDWETWTYGPAFAEAGKAVQS